MITQQRYSGQDQIWPLVIAETVLDPGRYQRLGVVTVTAGGHLVLLRADLELMRATDVTQQTTTIDSRYGPVVVAVYPGLTPSTPLWSLTADVGSHSHSPAFGVTMAGPGTYSIFVKNNTNRFALSYTFSSIWNVLV